MSVSNIPILFERFSDYMQHDCRGVEIFTYGVACAGLLTAFYKVRPFSRFTNPNKVPQFFFTKNILLEGTVKNIEFNETPFLVVDHKPLIFLPKVNKDYLPVKIAGVNITNNGFSWLHSIVKGKEITFLPISRDSKFLTCIVTVLEKNKGSLCPAKELIKIGFGTVEELPSSVTNKKAEIYQKSLKFTQQWAEHQRNGIWQEKISLTFAWKLKNFLKQQLKSRLPIYLVKYFNI